MYCNLCHDYNKVSLLYCQFFDGVLVGCSFALEDDLESICRHALSFLYFCLESLDLNGERGTESDG